MTLCCIWLWRGLCEHSVGRLAGVVWSLVLGACGSIGSEWVPLVIMLRA